MMMPYKCMLLLCLLQLSPDLFFIHNYCMLILNLHYKGLIAMTFSYQIKQNKAVLIYLFATLALVCFGLIYNKDTFEQTYIAQTITSTQQIFGSMPLPAEQEAAIRTIATEMGIKRNIIIRKMNQQALAQFGYHNAVAYNPMFYGIIPISSTSFMFISEDFFEELTAAEQRFLIGHEMAHIKHADLQYMPIAMLLLFIMLVALAIPLKNRCYLVIERHTKNSRLHFCAKGITLYLLLIFCFLTCFGISRAYRRYIEKEADITSLKLLASYDGLSQLIERWQNEFKVSEHNPYFGLIADHPSCAERKAYCCELQNQQNRKDLV